MQTHAINLIRHLVKRGYPIAVVTYQPGDKYEREAVKSTDTSIPCPVHRCLSRVGHVQNLSRLSKMARAFRPDLIYSSTIFYGRLGDELNIPMIARSVGNDVMRPWIAYPFRFASGIAAMPTIDQTLYRTFRRLDYPEPLETLFRRKRVELMVDSARRYTQILANSQFTYNLLTDIGVHVSRLALVVGGVDNQRFSQIRPQRNLRDQWGIPEDRFLLVTVCRLVPKKGIDFLIDSMDELRRRCPDIHLLVVGTGRKQKKLIAQAGRANVSDRITFAGRISHEEIETVYSAADAFVLASRVHVDQRTGLRDAETMGRVLCEANAAGLSVLAARSGGIPSVIEHEDNGLLFEPDDVDSLWEQLHRLRSEPALKQRLIASGRRYARDTFDWPIIIKRHETSFRSCLGMTIR